MTRNPRRAPAVLAILLIVAACGGASPTSAPDANGSPGVPAATSGAEPTAPPDTEPTDGGGGPGDGGGTFTGSACDLLTVAEVEGATGQAGVAAQLTSEGSFDGQSQCAFVSNGVLPVVIVTVTGSATNTDPAGYLLLPESERLAVTGADAIWMPAAGFVATVIKNGLVVAAGPIVPADGVEVKEVAAALAQKIADRMP